jgi:hypothetical protein
VLIMVGARLSVLGNVFPLDSFCQEESCVLSEM